MDRLFSRRLVLIVAFVVAVAGFAGAIGRYGWHQALHQVADRGATDLLLATDRLSGQLQLFQQLAVVTADHPIAAAALQEGARPAPDTGTASVLRRLADKTGALDVAVIAPDGTVIASAGGQLPPRVIDADWLRIAGQGALGKGHGPAPFATGPMPGRAWLFAAPVFQPAGGVAGVVLVVVDIERVEAEWRGARPAIWFTDAAGRVFITNRSELLGWNRQDAGLAPPDTTGLTPATIRRVAGHSLWRTDWSPYIPARALFLSRDLPMIGLRADMLIETEPARRLALLQAATVAAICLAFGAVLFLVLERRRTLVRANVRLEARVTARTGELRAEVAERRAAQDALTRAQAELVQAGKLSALGQMSAGISHELNQPLMAIQQFADNARAFLDRGQTTVAAENLTRIADLARRMGRIIQNLRAFARQESAPAGRVDLVGIIDAALDLAAPRLQAAGVTVHWPRPVAPVWVVGGEVRLGQVVVNLLTNAADAMTASPRRDVAIALTATPTRVVMEVADTGPGIREPERIFDPFYTTREVGAGDGMGLGLSISYGLVQSFGGAIRGRNRAEGGAVLTVELQPFPASAVRAAAAE